MNMNHDLILKSGKSSSKIHHQGYSSLIIYFTHKCWTNEHASGNRLGSRTPLIFFPRLAWVCHHGSPLQWSDQKAKQCPSFILAILVRPTAQHVNTAVAAQSTFVLSAVSGDPSIQCRPCFDPVLLVKSFSSSKIRNNFSIFQLGKCWNCFLF